jgi:hypothetical protein
MTSLGGGMTQVQCGAGGPGSFPTFDRTCAADSDCARVVHQINCCGSTQILGIAQSQQTAFTAAEMECESQYPGCGCAESPPIDQSGNASQSFDGSDITVSCLSGQCTSQLQAPPPTP